MAARERFEERVRSRPNQLDPGPHRLAMDGEVPGSRSAPAALVLTGLMLPTLVMPVVVTPGAVEPEVRPGRPPESQRRGSRGAACGSTRL